MSSKGIVCRITHLLRPAYSLVCIDYSLVCIDYSLVCIDYSRLRIDYSLFFCIDTGYFIRVGIATNCFSDGVTVVLVLNPIWRLNTYKSENNFLCQQGAFILTSGKMDDRINHGACRLTSSTNAQP
jgi:hypothetical protein